MFSPEITFNWQLNYKCNYRCPYCFYYNNWVRLSKLNKHLPAEKWVEAWHRIYEMYGTVRIIIIGGEPFIYPSFVDLMEILSKEHIIQIVTNLSCTMKTLTDFIHRIDITKIDMHISFHQAFVKYEVFLKKALFLKNEGISIRILYLAYPPQFKYIEYFKEKFEREGFYFVVVPFRGEYQGTIYPDGFSEKEKKKIIGDFSTGLKEEQKIWIKKQVFMKSTKGRLCRAGQIFSRIEPDGMAYRCGEMCGIKPIGNLMEEDFKLLDRPLPCEKDICPCEFHFLVDEEDWQRDLK